MKSILKHVAAAMVCAFATSASAAESDATYPEIYLRGTFSGWDVQEAYRFTRTGDTYTITVKDLDGNFKISDSEWNCEFGALEVGTAVTGTSSFYGMKKGPNFQAHNLHDVTIRFTLDMTAPYSPAIITFSQNGETPPAAPGQGMSGTLPVLYINVYTDATHSAFNTEITDRDLSHKNYFSDSEYWLDLNGCDWMGKKAQSLGSVDSPLPLEIKARGNWTRRGFSKKPFKLKLGSKQTLLGLSKSKHFALLAHADDTWGYMRNFTGFNLGHRIGLPWTPDQQPVEVVINGDYRGLYFLTESIRIEKDRINIAELDDLASDPALASGGYLVELDNYDEDNQIKLEEESCTHGHINDMLRITMDTPEEYSELQTRFVTDQFSAMNHYVGTNDDRLWNYLDIDDAARYYLVEEIVSHTESYHGSTYLFRDRGEGQKWHFSPLWDFGNAFSGPTDGFFYDHDPFGNTWIPSLRCNPRFNQTVENTWLWFMSNCYEGFEQDITSMCNRLQAAAQADRLRWKDKPVPDGGAPVADNSDMGSRCNAVLNHLRAKVNWMKGVFGDFTTGTFTEPARDDTPAAPLPEYLSDNVDIIYPGSADSAPQYYNLQGIRVSHPAPGQVYIVRRGENVQRIMIR